VDEKQARRIRVAGAEISANNSCQIYRCHKYNVIPERTLTQKLIFGNITMNGRASDEEALRLVIAFYCIMEPDKRAEVLALAEKFARESEVVEGATHFLMLDQKISSS
jgi:hypothetical protein